MADNKELIYNYIRLASSAITAGNKEEAKRLLLCSAEIAVKLVKTSTGAERQKNLELFNKIKEMVETLSASQGGAFKAPAATREPAYPTSAEGRTGSENKPISPQPVTPRNGEIKDENNEGENGVYDAGFNKNAPSSNPLSPRFLSDYIGQPQAVTAVKDLITAALIKNSALPHIILYGSHGLGKTTFSKIIANEMHANFTEINASKITAQEMVAILKKVKPKDIVFIDEIHTVPTIVAESVLYSAMQDGRITYTEGKGKFAKTESIDLPPFTLIGATTEIGKLAKPFSQRAILIHLYEYTDEVLGGIIARSVYKLGMNISDENALYIAKRCRNNPRLANNMVKRITDKALVKYAVQNNIADNGALNTVEKIRSKHISVDKFVIDTFFEENGIDQYGLEKGDRDLLSLIINKYKGGPVGIDTLARAMNESNNVISQKYEAYLIKKGLLKIDKDGRVAMPDAYKVLGLPIPPEMLEKTNSVEEFHEKTEEVKSKYDVRKVIASDVKQDIKCEKVEKLIEYPDNVTPTDASLDELFPDIEKDYDAETKHLCMLEVEFKDFKRTLVCDSFLESRFATCMASVGYLKDIKAQTLEIPYISQSLNNKRYFPDFVIKDYAGRIAIIEMKNFEMMSYHLNIDKYERLKEFCISHGYGYAEIMREYNAESYVSVEQIKNMPVSEKLSEYVYNKISENGAVTGEGAFTKADYEKYLAENPQENKTAIFTLLLNDRRLKNIDRDGDKLKVVLD